MKPIVKKLPKIAVFVYVVAITFCFFSSLYERIACGCHFEGIYSHFGAYRQENDDCNPPSLESVLKLPDCLLTAETLRCPTDDCEYIYIGGGRKGNDSIIAYEANQVHPITRNGIIALWDFLSFRLTCPKGINVLCNNGIAKFLTKDEFDAEIRRQSERNR